MPIRRWTPVACAISLVVAGCGDGGETTATSDRGTVSNSTSAPATSTSATTSTPSAATPDLPASIDLGAPAWSAVYGFGGVWIQVDPPVDQIVKVDEASGAVTLTIDGGRGAAIGPD